MIEMSYILTKYQYFTIVLQDVTTGGNWVKGTQDLCILLLTTVCESTLSQNKIFNFKTVIKM